VAGVGTEHVRWLSEPTSTSPVIVAAFTGWNDAADAASTAMRTLIEAWSATALAEVDPEVFTDFATVRPHVKLDDHRRRMITWPTVGIWSASVPGADVVLVLGPEPALRWREFTDQLVGVAERVGASMAISLGALLADVPHSRPVPMIGTATDDTMIERFELQRSSYEGPTGIVGVLHDALQTAGFPTASLWAAVPGYAAQVPSPKAAVALVERACAMIGTPPPLSNLSSASAEYDARVAALIGDDDDMVEYLARLEEIVDAGGLEDDPFDDDPFDDDDTIDEDSLDPDAFVEEVEQFLRDRHDD
jgi:proteasome assembly chaperone (PAC2) family protein